ncbi:hypothetical protein [Streptomyces sp. NPDC102462]|uniref:hypothetical protein n=1 Tax=Streptomyces sp. NPDC102462 TaxID=3366178 RepID=UPI0037FF1776
MAIIFRPRAAAWALVLSAAVACTPAQSPPAPPTASGPTSAPSTAAARRAGAVEPPELAAGLGETLAAERRATHGNASLAYSGGPRGRALVVAVSCRGRGSVSVSVPVLHVSFPQECGTTEPAVAYNEFALKNAYKPGTVSVTAPSAVTWAVTIGHVPPAHEEPPQTG